MQRWVEMLDKEGWRRKPRSDRFWATQLWTQFYTNIFQQNNISSLTGAHPHQNQWNWHSLWCFQMPATCSNKVLISTPRGTLLDRNSYLRSKAGAWVVQALIWLCSESQVSCPRACCLADTGHTFSVAESIHRALLQCSGNGTISRWPSTTSTFPVLLWESYWAQGSGMYHWSVPLMSPREQILRLLAFNSHEWNNAWYKDS